VGGGNVGEGGWDGGMGGKSTAKQGGEASKSVCPFVALNVLMAPDPEDLDWARGTEIRKEGAGFEDERLV